MTPSRSIVGLLLAAALALPESATGAAGLASKEVTVDPRTKTRVSLQREAAGEATRLYVATLSRNLFFPDSIELVLDGEVHRLECEPEVVRGETPAFFGGGGPYCDKPSASYCELSEETLERLLAAGEVALELDPGSPRGGPAMLSQGQVRKLRKLRSRD